MPRNIRRKAAPPPRRKSRRDSTSSSSLDLSSDGGYSALEDLSDSEDDDEDGVDATEEQYIIKDVAKNRNVRSAPRSEIQTKEVEVEEEEEEDDDDDDDDDDSDGVVIEDEDDAEEGDEEDDEDEDDDEEGVDAEGDDTEWNGIATESEVNTGGASLVPKRQVRFAGVPDSDSDSTTTELSDVAAEFFPDIFVEQNSLDPAFRREIEDESDSTVSSSFWDYSSAYDNGNNGGGASLNVPYSDDDLVLSSAVNDPYGLTTIVPTTPLATVTEEDEAPEASDGYETDGDTTEDEDLEELPVRRKVPRRIQSVDGASTDTDSESDVSVRHRRGHPRVGRFVLDANSSKPVAVMHPVTGKMVIFTPEKPRQYEVMSDALPAGLDLLPPPHADISQSSPLITNSASVMMGAMFSSHTFGDYMHSQNVGPVEAFFPSINSDAFLGDESDYSGDLMEDDGEFNLRLEDFIQFERSISDTGDKTEGLEDKSVLQSETDDNGLLNMDMTLDMGLHGEGEEGDDGATPVATPTNARRDSFTVGLSSAGEEEEEEIDSPMPPLLAHFDKNANAVGAFRRNQIDQQLIYSNKATAESLAFSGPYIMGTLRGIKNGSLEAVTTPITPPRRRKRHSMSRHSREEYIRSPLSSVVQKRKASGAPSEGSMDHKRQRSISEVKDLML